MPYVLTTSRSSLSLNRARHGRAIRRLSIVLLLIGIVVVGLGSTIFELSRAYINDPKSEISIGIDVSPLWGGVLMIISAGIGIAAGKRGNQCLLITMMVLSIFAAIFSAAVAGFSLHWTLAVSQFDRDHYQDTDRYRNVEYPKWRKRQSYENFLSAKFFEFSYWRDIVVYGHAAIVGLSTVYGEFHHFLGLKRYSKF